MSRRVLDLAVGLFWAAAVLGVCWLVITAFTAVVWSVVE